jgi:hypothetical protein
MGNYFPASNPAANFVFTAAGTIAGGDPVQFTGSAQGDGQVQRAVDGSRHAGIAAQDATAGHSLTVYIGPALFLGTAEGSVAAGDPLAASAVPGRQVRTALPGEDAIGHAFGNAADGTNVHWVQR